MGAHEPGLPMAERLEQFLQTTHSMPQDCVAFTVGAFQQWLTDGYVTFLEVFKGCGELTIRAGEQGFSTGEGLDRDALAYGMAWPLQDDQVAADAAWLVAEALRPLVLHVATPCTDNCVIGKKEVSPDTDKHRAQRGGLAAPGGPPVPGKPGTARGIAAGD